MTVTVFAYLILISIDFYDFIFSLVLVSIEKIYQTLETVFDILLHPRSFFVSTKCLTSHSCSLSQFLSVESRFEICLQVKIDINSLSLVTISAQMLSLLSCK